MLKAVGARLWYLPPYSPDLNPIEKAFSRIKHWMRLDQKRTPEGLSRYVGKLLKTIRPSDQPNAATTSKAPDMITSKHETL